MLDARRGWSRGCALTDQRRPPDSPCAAAGALWSEPPAGALWSEPPAGVLRYEPPAREPWYEPSAPRLYSYVRPGAVRRASTGGEARYPDGGPAAEE